MQKNRRYTSRSDSDIQLEETFTNIARILKKNISYFKNDILKEFMKPYNIFIRNFDFAKCTGKDINR